MDAVTELSAIREIAKTDPGLAGRQMVLGLMLGDADAYKAGYTAENALAAAVSYLDGDSDALQRHIVQALTPDPCALGDEYPAFLRYLIEQGADADALVCAVEKPRRHWQHYADYLVSREPNSAGAPTPLGASA